MVRRPLPPGGTALITGASSGIGEAFARQLARRGCNVVLVARRLERLEELATTLSAINEIEAEALAADLTTARGVKRAASRLVRGDIDLLVNNAGFGTVGRFAELSIERELEEIDLNVRALVRLTHAALDAMMPRGAGAIINVASMAAYQPVPYNATYAATKAFVLNFSEAVHEEVKSKGVTVSCLCPGPVRTEFQEVAGINGHTMRGRPLLRYMAQTSPEDVVEAALEGLEAGRATVIPGGLNKAIVETSRLGPRPLVRRLSGMAFSAQGDKERTDDE